MKKLVLGMALGISVVCVTNLNAAELKCDSREAKIAFVKAELDLKPNEINTLKKDGHVMRKFDDGGVEEISIEKNAILISGEGGTNYVNFKLIKDNKTNKICETTEESSSWQGEEMIDTKTKIRFTLQQDSKGNLVAKKAK